MRICIVKSPMRWQPLTLLCQCIQSRTLIHQQQQRSLHGVPPLGFDKQFAEHGIPGLLSADAFRMAWTQYQGMIIAKLNELTAGEPMENQSPKSLAIQFARDPMAASLFNHASMAYNNHFFFSGLSTLPMQLSDSRISLLQPSLEQTFGSIETLRTTFLETAAAMFGPGFVWLVYCPKAPQPSLQKGSWRILTTYLAGSPFPEAGYRQQGIDMSTQNANSYQSYLSAQPTNTAGAFGSYSKIGREESRQPPGGTSLIPVLCVNTWEHVYIRDYGVEGKRQYLKDWWDAIDWESVYSITPPGAQQLSFTKV
nr:putative 37s ribosomal protein s26b, mitochondrial [Quercus suber]